MYLISSDILSASIFAEKEAVSNPGVINMGIGI
jgi:hypothetical protein